MRPLLAPDDPALADAVARLTARHAEAVRALGRDADIVGFHGQTILHQPARRRTWQIGDAAAAGARETGMPVAYDFRSADIAAGGEGAPLAPVYHAALAAALRPAARGAEHRRRRQRDLDRRRRRAAGLRHRAGQRAARRLDRGPHRRRVTTATARWRPRGRVDAAVLARLLAHPYFARPPPKSLDRLDFSAALAASGLAALAAADGAATLVAFTAEAVARAPLPAPPRRWLVSGGGRHNPAIMAALRARLRPPVEPVEAVGWDGDALEAQCFGFLAVRVRRGLPLSFPGTTGVPRPCPAGGSRRRPERQAP